MSEELENLEVEHVAVHRPKREDYPFAEGEKAIIVRSKSGARAFMTPGCSWAAIQITTYPNDWPVLNATKRSGLLQLAFLDMDRHVPGIEDHDSWSYGSRLFTPENADQILDFVNEMWDKVDLFLVHCEAGISRSPAVAAALCKIKHGHDQHFFDNYTPNRLVYRTLLDRAIARGIFVP
jgi:predicted protein tyrosine phosphatase